MKFRLIINIKVFAFFLILPSIAAANPIAPHWAIIDSTAPARQGFKAVYNTERNSIVLFGGSDSTGLMPEDTWEWNSFGWQQIDTTGPPGRAGFGMCYDRALDLVILFGGWNLDNGYLDDTWIWNGSYWINLNIPGPAARSDFSMAYDEGNQSILLFGGGDEQTLYGDTWQWNETGWSQLDITGPPARIFSSMVNMPNYQVSLIFGGQAGYNGEVFGDAWIWVGSVWLELEGNNPSSRVGQMMAFDPSWGESVVLFGGQDALSPDVYYDDTWEFNDWGWSLTGISQPSARSLGETVYDDSLQQVILIGGENNSQIFQEMWAYPSFDVSCQYIPGDVNASNSFTGLDVTYSVRFFKGGAQPLYSCECPSGSGNTWFVTGDVNGSCSFSGLDVTYMVRYFKGGAAPMPCQDCLPGRR
ncbi:MAG TPA: hypothetical protein DCZ43_04440 [candidate division Zixibacteria bacterium]|nr:hypothetical protein [candidate division Zixibacteria bacterium]